jgi:hypothetical protein
MKRTVVLISLFLFGMVSAASAATRNLQYWKNESLSWGIAKDWKLGLSSDIYFKDNASDFYYQRTELGVTYSGLAKWLDLSVTYTRIVVESNNIWKREEEPVLVGTFKWTVKGFAISDKNRFEYRIIEDAEDGWRYRNQVQVKAPWKWTRFAIQPYVADEFFVDINSQVLNDNRVQPGFSFKLTKELSMDIYYMWRRVKSTARKTLGKWLTQDILGTRLKLTF